MLTINEARIEIYIAGISEEELAQVRQDIEDQLRRKYDELEVSTTQAEGTYCEW